MIKASTQGKTKPWLLVDLHWPGCFGECSSEEDQVKRTRENCFLLYECSVFNTFVELLSMEAE